VKVDRALASGLIDKADNSLSTTRDLYSRARRLAIVTSKGSSRKVRIDLLGESLDGKLIVPDGLAGNRVRDLAIVGEDTISIL
jgi:hypothetical protein